MNKVLFPFAILLLCVANCVIAAQAQNWSLVWSDEFTQPDGSAPDSTKWGYDVGGTGWGNNELEYYTSRTNNARIEGGQLVIEALQENYGGKNYTSARLLTKGKWSWTFGRIEARIKIPRGQGLWPAFWTLGTNIDSVKWPTCGEIDIMETSAVSPARCMELLMARAIRAAVASAAPLYYRAARHSQTISTCSQSSGKPIASSGSWTISPISL